MEQLAYKRTMGHFSTQTVKDGDKLIVASEMECDEMIRTTRMIRQQREQRGDPEGFRLVARFPAVFAEKAMLEGWFHDDDKWRQLVNDPQYAAFRVSDGAF